MQARTPLYTLCDVKLKIKNTFIDSQEDFADFQISLIPQLSKTEPTPQISKQQSEKNIKKKKDKKKGEPQEQEHQDLSIPDAFFLTKDKCKLKKNET